MNIRAFFALPLKESVVRRLSDHADSLCHLDPKADVLWVDSDHFHLTLCFLGEISLEQVSQLEQQANKSLAATASFQVPLQDCEYYPVNQDLAVIAAIADLTVELAALRERLIGLLSQTGIDTRQQDFKPHVTLGRVAREEPFNAPEQWPSLELLAIADSVVLYQSKAGSNGSIYTPLFEIPLQSDKPS